MIIGRAIMTKNSSHTMLKRVIAPLAVWAVTKVLDAPNVKKTMNRVDGRFYKQRRKAERAVVRASTNAMNNRVWLAAGVVAIVTGMSLLAKSTRPR
jgi:hypothetical protein